MGYYVRVLSRSDAVPSYGTLREALGGRDLLLVEGADEEWTELIIQHEGVDIALVDRVTIVSDTMGAGEIEWFLEQLDEAEPASAADWLRDYLPQVKTIYALRILSAAWEEDRFDHVSKVRQTIWRAAGGILQADHEGFTNEEGYQILWQFADDVDGDWWMAVLENGIWRHFRMDLGNPEHRKAFKAGKVPSEIGRGILGIARSLFQPFRKQ
ncbi:MAG TPA: hypothetical protein VFF38_08055 [Microvirga sp.]|nr:hypothetical protein [Microvirga sp.]